MSLENEAPEEPETNPNNDHVEAESNENRPTQQVVRRESSWKPWKSPSKTSEDPLAAGLSDEDLWMFLRRFNRQIYYVKATQDIPQGLDLNRTEDERFPPEKLRITIERFYTSVVVKMANFFNHVTRLRSWKEPKRTSIFCATYFAAWFMDLLVPTITGILIAMILCPPIRFLLFPDTPTAPVDPDSDGTQPATGDPGLHDSITGAPERHKGEAAEQEASDLVNIVADVAIESASGKYGQAVTEDAPEEPSDPEATVNTTGAIATAADLPPGNGLTEPKTKKPMKKKVSKVLNQVMRVVSDVTDIYERFSNVLSPTPPFGALMPRLRLVGILMSTCLVSRVPSYWIVKGCAFAVGFSFFGDPVFQRTLDFLNHKVPNWKKALDLHRTLLKSVPTNAQLTLTLLRIGELNANPLPPPPSAQENEPLWPIRRKKSQTPALNRTSDQNGSLDLRRQQTTDSGSPPKSKRRFAAKLFKFVRRTISTAIKSHATFDRAMTMAGSMQAKHLVNLLENGGWVSPPVGPLKFDAKFERKRGAAVVDSTKEPPVLYFTTNQSSVIDDLRLESRKKGSVLFQIPVTDIRELKKTEGLGWKGKLIVELTAGSKDSADGLIISGTESDQIYHLTGMRARNQLFNRLIALGAQFWESR